MTEIVPVPDGDRRRLAEITDYLSAELARADGAAPGIHVHYHAAPAAPAPAPAEVPAGERMLARLAPYYVLMLGGCIVLAIIGVIAVLLVPAMIALATDIAMIMGGFAVACIAVAASVRSLRQSKTESRAASKVLDRASRGRR
jgi:hypothetical protein